MLRHLPYVWVNNLVKAWSSCCSISFLRGVYGALVVLTFLKPPSQGSGGGGEEKPDFLRSKNVALCLFTSKAMAALRWFLPRENSRIINRKVKFEIFAIPWFCLKSLAFFMTGRRNRAPKPHGSSPRAPLLRLAFYMDQKMGQRKVSDWVNSREIQCKHHLVAGLFVRAKSVLKGRRKRCGVAPPPKRLHEAFAKTF